MELKRQKRTARLLLAAFVVLNALALFWARPASRISTDVLELVPTDERQPELALVRSLAGAQQARVALFALDVPGTAGQRQAAGTVFMEALKKSRAFEEVVALQDQTSRDFLGQALFRQRFNLLLPAWLAAHRATYAAARSREPWPDWLAAQAASELQAFLNQPEALAFQDLVPSDPLLLIPGLAGSVKGLDQPAAPDGGPVLIWTLLRQPPLAEEGQQPVFAAVDEALRLVRAANPEAHLRWTSLARFAAASRRRIEGELSTLNVASLLAVLVVAAACLRNLWKAIHLAPVVLGAVLFAWTVTLVAFPHVHVLVFVVGSLLTGVAIDYGFYLYLQPPAFAGEPYLRKAGRLLRPLLGSALTAILGFSLLLFSELPLIRQLGVFVSAGLAGALAVALLWFAQVREPYMETRAFTRARIRPTRANRWGSRALLAGGAVVALTGPWRLQWHDDIREMEIPAPALQMEAHEVRVLFGDRDERTAYLTHGATIAQAREALDRFLAWHRQAYPGSAISSAASILPDPAEWGQLPAARAALRDFPRTLGRALAEAGFDAASFAPFNAAWDSWIAAPLPTYEEEARSLAGSMHGPLGGLFSISDRGAWFISVADQRADRDPPPELGTARANQLENLNRLFNRYRTSALQLSGLGLGLVGLSVFGIYGLKRGAGIFAVPLGACLFTVGLFGLAGQTLNLFHLLGAFLGVCLGHNYSIFAAENDLQAEALPPSIRLSALCTAASFGVLTLSHIRVVAALGSTVLLLVLSALAIVELKPLARFTPRPEP